MLSEFGLPGEFWAKAVNTAVYLMNLCPSKAINLSTPFELKHKRMADYSHLKDPLTRKVIVSRDVSFNELDLLKEKENSKTPRIDKGKSPITEIVVGDFDHYIITDLSQEGAPVHQEQEKHEQIIIDEPIAIVSENGYRPKTSTMRSHHASMAPERFGVWANSSILEDCDFDVEDRNDMALILEEVEPSSYRKAQTSVNKLEWNATMEWEMEFLIDNKTWELVQTLMDQTLIDSKWVYKLKDNPGGDEARIFKAKLVAKGFIQEKCVDYNKVFSPVAKYATIRLVCALAVIFDLLMDQMDVVTAFVYGYLE
ncbi:hypothetical protein AXG93_167s1270 [Marchantia polymorpha subsp. ruderalis]|uniref:Reverse transcriptase Ty1/copia-type domain-containing protein n=1 Tax=Marchantia polymorpha subsp. ruderalis TaxID=1480154 RepID=A0A176WQP3_MARPO|nr:hypothetical protein AXG93_167s1270 [Marchantia polymorpha subsp. ruderalis]